LATFLYIDTAGDRAAIAISKNTQLMSIEYNEVSTTHASFVQVAIQSVLEKCGISIRNIDAVAVTLGPGSYTGLRVGLASAKGIAYALEKPLIGISTLALLAKEATTHPAFLEHKNLIQVFSMIDAKRMEVFGAIYSAQLTTILPEQAIVLDAPFILSFLQNGPLICVGNGATKTKNMLTAEHLYFMESTYTMNSFIQLVLTKWENQDFEDVAYSKPAYLKEFYQPNTK